MASTKVNGVAYQFANMTLSISDSDGNVFPASNRFKELNYSDSVDREKVRGADRKPLDATDGEYDADGNVIFFRDFYNAIVAWAAERGLGFYDLQFDMRVDLRKRTVDRLETDVIKKVMFATRDKGGSQGADALEVACDLFILGGIYVNGQGPFAGDTL